MNDIVIGIWLIGIAVGLPLFIKAVTSGSMPPFRDSFDYAMAAFVVAAAAFVWPVTLGLVIIASIIRRKVKAQ